ncbi:MAG: hypothetical protein J6D57_00635 [Mogibacterium sp.]|nr:hypothetical protein [Mogibacterium sp.]
MRNSESFRAKNVEHYCRSKDGAKESGCPGPAVSSTGRKRTKRIATALGMLALCFAVTFGCVLPSATQIAFADDLVNTVPNEEAPAGKSFYSGEIRTGFDNYPSVSSKYGPGYGPYTNVTGVYQSLSTVSPTSFAAGLPLGTIFIDQSKISASSGIIDTTISGKSEIFNGLVKNCGGLTGRVGYDGTKEGAIRLEAGKINELKGDLFSVTFKDAAIKPNGERADLVITYSNARIVVDQRYAYAPQGERYLHGAAYLATGNAFSYGTTDTTLFARESYGRTAEEAVNTLI